MSILPKILTYSFCTLSLLGGSFLYAASDDDYLKQLEAEAIDESTDNPMEPASFDADIGEGPTLDAPATDVELITNKKELIVDRKSFEKALKVTYPESHTLYEQLSESQKESIYQDFTQKKRLYNSTVKIISTYIGSH